MAQGIQSLTVLVDTREQTPWAFSSGVATLRASLPSGDYSLPGLTEKVALERKSFADLAHSLTSARDRFFREIERLSQFEHAALVIEYPLDEVMRGNVGRSQATPASIIGSCLAIHVDYGVPVVWAGSRPSASHYAERMLARIWNLYQIKSKSDGKAAQAAQSGKSE